MKKATVNRTVSLPPELDKALAVEAAIQSRYVRDIVAEALQQYLDRMGKGREGKPRRSKAA